MVSSEAKRAALRVHVSCCVRDLAFVEKLVDSLRQTGDFEVTTSATQDASAGDPNVHAGKLIAEADTVLFVLSHAANSSRSFAWEVEQALGQSKRARSILCERMRKTEVIAALADTRRIAFYDHLSFADQLDGLVRFLKLDGDWLRQHTQLYARARRWEQAAAKTSELLSAQEIAAAKRWTLDRPENSARPTDLHLKFIEASEAALRSVGSATQREADALQQKKRSKTRARRNPAQEKADSPGAAKQRRIAAAIPVMPRESGKLTDDGATEQGKAHDSKGVAGDNARQPQPGEAVEREAAAGEIRPADQEREIVPYRKRRWSLTAVNPVKLLRTNKGSQVQRELAEVVPGEAIIAGGREQRQIQYRLVAALSGVSIIFGVGATWLVADGMDRLPAASIEQTGVQRQAKGEPVKPGIDARGTGDVKPTELVECSGPDLNPGGNGCVAAARQTGVASAQDEWFDFDQ